MREFITREAEDHYTIIFETDDRKAFEQVQTLCRILIDGKDGEAIPIEWARNWATKCWVKSGKCEYDIIVSRMIDEWVEERCREKENGRD